LLRHVKKPSPHKKQSELCLFYIITKPEINNFYNIVPKGKRLPIFNPEYSVYRFPPNQADFAAGIKLQSKFFKLPTGPYSVPG